MLTNEMKKKFENAAIAKLNEDDYLNDTEYIKPWDREVFLDTLIDYVTNPDFVLVFSDVPETTIAELLEDTSKDWTDVIIWQAWEEALWTVFKI